MKRLAAILFVLLCISAYGRSVEVSRNGKLQSLRKAIEIAAPGDTIFV
jgi:hypothetical protein